MNKIAHVNGDTLNQNVNAPIVNYVLCDENDEVNKMFGYSKNAMPNNFISNHDLPRYGDLIQRAAIWFKYDKEETEEEIALKNRRYQYCVRISFLF